VSRFTTFGTYDVRFPTSLTADGSDAMNRDGNYSAAYVVARTDDGEVEGHGFAFTIGRGNDVQLAAIREVARRFAGREVSGVLDDLGGAWRELVHDSQLRWLGPEKGVMHMAIGAVINALWDLKARIAGMPLWQLLARMDPEELVGLVDFRYLSDALEPGEALDLLRAARQGSREREASLVVGGFPAYTTTPGWLGYSDDRLKQLCAQAVASGFRQVKVKVGRDLDEDRRRLGIAREAVGDGVAIAVDANQVWDVGSAISWIRELAGFGLAWVEEPTSPDDILGHAAIRSAVAPIRIATGEHGASRVIFKQLLQAEAIDVMQIDACRVAGVNENIANILLAAKFGVPVCPHAGGVGLCEAVQHLAMWDYVAVSGTTQDRMIEWIDHLHEHFEHPARVEGGRYLAPLQPGASTALRSESLKEYAFPGGPAWKELARYYSSGSLPCRVSACQMCSTYRKHRDTYRSTPWSAEPSDPAEITNRNSSTGNTPPYSVRSRRKPGGREARAGIATTVMVRGGQRGAAAGPVLPRSEMGGANSCCLGGVSGSAMRSMRKRTAAAPMSIAGTSAAVSWGWNCSAQFRAATPVMENRRGISSPARPSARSIPGSAASLIVAAAVTSGWVRSISPMQASPACAWSAQQNSKPATPRRAAASVKPSRARRPGP
jgi:L-fuconate dehydratase